MKRLLAVAVAVALGFAVLPAVSATAADPLSISDNGSYWQIVNKQRPLVPKSYVPKDLVKVPGAGTQKLRKTASAATVKLFAAFHKQTKLRMQVQSAYRSYTQQVATYNFYVKRLGKKAADATTARPGFSEHQTGLAVDVSAPGCLYRTCFAATKQAKWLAKNAWRYGFVLRYPSGQTATTGYAYEPWHNRYVGVALSTELHSSKTPTLEGFFGLPKAPGYK